MRAEYIDGMLSGSKDAMEAVMDGYISFAGDAGKGLTIARLEADMKRIYNAIVDELGSPGDLAGIPLPGGAIIGAPAIVGLADIRQQLLDTVNELYAEGVITATGGNVSVRNPDVEGQIWITPSQVFKGDLTPELMVLIDLDGKPLIPGQKAPSSEKSFHTQILTKKPEANVVIHAHAPFATILANAGIPFLPISSEAAFFGGDIARVPYMTPGSDELAEAVSDIMMDEWAVFMVNHGVVCAGRSLRKACDMIQIIDRTAEVILGCFAVGKEPPLLPQSAIDKFRAIGDIIA
jgi:autoinducer 2 (AI-2) kinase